MRRDGEINALVTGGSIVHISVDSKLTSTQAAKLIEDAVKFGMAHFALNCVYSECVSCGKVVKGKLDVCECGSHKINHFSRVIGYFSRIEGWIQTRRTKDFPNRQFVTKDKLKKELGD